MVQQTDSSYLRVAAYTVVALVGVFALVALLGGFEAVAVAGR